MLRTILCYCLILTSLRCCLSFPGKRQFGDRAASDFKRFCKYKGHIKVLTDPYCWFKEQDCTIFCQKRRLAQYKAYIRDPCQDVIDIKTIPIECAVDEKCMLVCPDKGVEKENRYDPFIQRDPCQGIIAKTPIPFGCTMNEYCMIMCPRSGVDGRNRDDSTVDRSTINKKTYVTCKYDGNPIRGCSFNEKCEFKCKGKARLISPSNVKKMTVVVCKYKGTPLREGCKLNRKCKIKCSKRGRKRKGKPRYIL